jgi:hypothetical protein
MGLAAGDQESKRTQKEEKIHIYLQIESMFLPTIPRDESNQVRR